MKSNTELNGDFVENWISNQKTDTVLDQDVLLLIDKHRKGSKLDETGLLKSLIAASNVLEDSDEAD